MKNLERIQSLESVKIWPNNWEAKINFTKTKVASAIEGILQNKNNLESNLDLAREIQLAKIFWLSNNSITKLKEDYNEPLTATKVLETAGIYWNNRNYKKIKNNSPIKNDKTHSLVA